MNIKENDIPLIPGFPIEEWIPANKFAPQTNGVYLCVVETQDNSKPYKYFSKKSIQTILAIILFSAVLKLDSQTLFNVVELLPSVICVLSKGVCIVKYPS